VTDFPEWLTAVTNGASARSIATKLGDVQNTAVSRWLRGEGAGRVPAEQVIKVARAYDASVVEGLCAAGYLTTEELALYTDTNLARFGVLDMLDELHRREVLRQKIAAEPTVEIEQLVGDLVDRAVESRVRAGSLNGRVEQ